MKRSSLIHKFGNLLFILVFSTGLLVYESQITHTQDAEIQDSPNAVPKAVQQEQTPKAITCPEKPPMGQRAKLLDDQEIGLVFYEDKLPSAAYFALNNPRGDKNLVYLDDVSCQSGACKSIGSPAIAMADLDGDDQIYSVIAFRDSEKRVALGFRTGEGLEEIWYNDQNNTQGKNVNWIDIAAGNLDVADTHDKSEEVVIAFSDDSHALNLMIPAAVDADPNRLAAYYRDDTSDGRGKVKYVSVAAGDLDGDGYDNEIVTAFKDGNNHLQAMVFKKEAGKQVLKVLWHKFWTNNYRTNIAQDPWSMGWNNDLPVDVTTGDLDGDFKDEVIIAFRDGFDETRGLSCKQAPYTTIGFPQLLVLDGTTSGDFDDQVWARADATAHCPGDIYYGDDQEIWTPTVSVAAADLDGDGGKEIALAFSTSVLRPGNHHYYIKNLWTYDYVDVNDPDYAVCLSDDGKTMIPCLQLRDNKWVTNYDDHKYDRISMDAGDLYRDGIAEITMGYTDYDGLLHITTYDAKDKLTLRKNLTVNTGGAQVKEFALGMGDIDKDAVFGTYTNNHYLAWNSYVETVVHAPPYWPGDNEEGSEAGFGTSVGHGGGSGESSETSMGGSVTVKYQFEDVGPSFTAEWEKSCAVEQTDVTVVTEGTTFKTVPPPGEHDTYYMDAVGYHMCPRCCYEYIESAYHTPTTICLPVKACSQAVSGLDAWYKDRAHADPPEGVGDSWVPVGMNMARGKPSEQYSPDYGGVASRAVDGNTDGVFDHNSVTFSWGPQAWWQVDMAILPAVHAVQLWNRTDAEPDRLADFYVFLSEKPFSSNDPEVLRQDAGVWHYFHAGSAERLTTAAWSDFRDHQDQAPERSGELTGRYLRVQLTSDRPLSLAEVQVWGVPSRVDQWPVGEPFPTIDKTFTIELPDGSNQIVDGEFILKRNGTLHVDDQGSPEFDNSIEEEWEKMVETSTEATAKVGFSIKVAEGEYTTGSKNVRSRIMTWSKETEFSGEAGMIGEKPHYDYAPYLWLQRATSPSGLEQSFLVVDYWVPDIQPQSSPELEADSGNITSEPIQPQIPLIESASHPDAETWYDSNTAVFSWTQPPGDPAVISGYRWYLDRNPDTIPPTLRAKAATGYTYDTLDDGIWYLHVRAKGEGELWSDSAHRAIRIDTRPPQVELFKEPALPSGHSGWYKSPLSIQVDAQDTDGSGVAMIEVSTDNLTWQPYSGSMLFEADTPGTDLWAKASDGLGHVSEPISTTFKIDCTPPDSSSPHGPLPGFLFAEVVADEMGNEHPVFAGVVEDALSGQAGMDIEIHENDWTSTLEANGDFWYAFPGPIADQATWYYDGLYELSRGNHYLRGRSLDRAGNLEVIYDMGELVWFPQASPDLVGSSLTAAQAVARPGETVSLVAAVRNSGNQEAWVELSSTLPIGMTPVVDLLPSDVNYDPVYRILKWPAKLLWPGEWHRHHFKVQLDPGLGAEELEIQARAQTSWPNTDDLPTSQRRRFEELEQTVDFSTSVAVDPNLPPGEDVMPPWVFLSVLGDQMQTSPQVELSIQASAEARWMYIREWTLNADTGDWQVAQDSGWLPFSQNHAWNLSPGAGIKYIGVWVADEDKNISTLDEHSLDFTNLLSGVANLLDGQRHQYRFDFERGELKIFNLLASQGDPDLYAWDPYHALLPNYAAERNQLVDVLGFYTSVRGMHIFEVLGNGESDYRLLPMPLAGPEQGGTPEVAEAAKIRPPHPLTMSTPLTSGTGTIPDLPDFTLIHFPMISKE